MTNRKEALLKLVERVEDDGRMVRIEDCPEEEKWVMFMGEAGKLIHLSDAFQEKYNPPRKPVPDGEWALAWNEDESRAVPLRSTGRINDKGKLVCHVDTFPNATKAFENWKHLVVKDD